MAELEIGKIFLMSDGKRLSTIEDLTKALENVNEQTFRAHVTDDRNDFADWISSILDDRVLANELRCTTSNVEMIETLKRTLGANQNHPLSVKFVPTSSSSGLLATEDAKASKNSKSIQEPPKVEENSIQDAPDISDDYHEDAAPLIENQVLTADSFAEPTQTVDAASVTPNDHYFVEDPEKAPTFESNPETVSKERLSASAQEDHLAPSGGEPLIPSSESLLSSSIYSNIPDTSAINLELPTAGEGLLPEMKEGDSEGQGNPLLLRFLILYQYILSALRFNYVKKREPEEKISK